MPITDKELADLAVFVLCAEDMHHDVKSAAEKLTPDLDRRIPADWDVMAYLVAKDALLPMSGVHFPLLLSDDPLFYGYLAQSRSKPKAWVVAVRGTAGLVEWIIDGQFLWKDHPDEPGVKVEQGFWDIYASMSLNRLDGSLIDANACKGIAGMIGQEGRVQVSGHSLGSSLATYLTFDLAKVVTNRVEGYFFASPRTGDQAWVDRFAETVKEYQVINYALDVVPHLPTRPDYSTLPNVRILDPASSQAAIRVDVGCNHHLICYCALLDYDTAADLELLPTDLPCRACINGRTKAVSWEAKSLATAIKAVGDSADVHVSALFRGMFALEAP